MYQFQEMVEQKVFFVVVTIGLSSVDAAAFVLSKNSSSDTLVAKSIKKFIMWFSVAQSKREKDLCRSNFFIGINSSYFQPCSHLFLKSFIRIQFTYFCLKIP